jgi:hypothetical protein
MRAPIGLGLALVLEGHAGGYTRAERLRAHQHGRLACAAKLQRDLPGAFGAIRQVLDAYMETLHEEDRT